MKKVLVILASCFFVAAIAFAGIKFFLDNSDDSKENNSAGNPTQSNMVDTNSKKSATKKSSEKTTTGRYTTYSEGALGAEGYDTNVVFFFAPWCPECRAFKEAINSKDIPDGVQVLEADFDSSTDLKSKYGVTLQSTFVKVDESGEQESKYVGYGKNKSLNSVLSKLR